MYTIFMTFPDFSYEKDVWENGFTVVGIDEAGRGAFAGPLSVGGVVLNPKLETELGGLGINDSKLLSPKKREILFEEIIKRSLAWHVEFVPVSIINKIGIGKSTFLGMRNLVQNLKLKIQSLEQLHILVDGFTIPDLNSPQTGIIHGDRLSISIAASSILAKVVRDRYMLELAKQFPIYGFEKHKGYGTKFHREALSMHGLSQHHRVEFCKNTTFVVSNPF